MGTPIKPAVDIRILVVDDTADNLRVLAKMLESRHYQVFKALSGKMALQVAHHNPPDLILLDINMPEMNGYQVCQQLKSSEKTAHIPIIFISALDQADYKVQAFELGGQDYITKPFQELEVFARIKNQLLIQQQKEQLQQEIRDRQLAEAEVRRLNIDLERQVQLRTLELQQALGFEVALKQISDQVRDSLNQHQVLQKTVETLASTLQSFCCDVVLYDAEQICSTLHYRWSKPGMEVNPGKTLYLSDCPEIYTQLQQRLSFAFCPLHPTIDRDYAAILACPIFDDQVNDTGILGDLWLFRERYSSFGESEIHLVQQAANQCAIALRQARLYETAQAQVQELERLNMLKDDFLSTISHELRTPIASMKMVIKLLNTVTDHGRNFVEEIAKSSVQDNKVVRYFNVLQEECDRELALIEALLSLQHIEAGTYTSFLTSINLYEWLPYRIQPFETRAQNQYQTLTVEIAPDLPTISLDTLSVERVTTELLNNACKYTPANERISVSVAIAPIPTQQPSPTTAQLIFSVTNTGVEIPCDELTRIFDKFYRIPNNDPWKYGGTGLGLALAKKLVEQMGGTLQVESQPNQTCFTVRLPVQIDPVQI